MMKVMVCYFVSGTHKDRTAHHSCHFSFGFCWDWHDAYLQCIVIVVSSLQSQRYVFVLCTGFKSGRTWCISHWHKEGALSMLLGLDTTANCCMASPFHRSCGHLSRRWCHSRFCRALLCKCWQLCIWFYSQILAPQPREGQHLNV